MGYVARFRKGAKTLDISSGIYQLSDWIPPRANIQSTIASGTSANRYGGGVKVSERAFNTSTVFSVRVVGGSNAEVEAGAKAIESLLRQAGDEAEPLFLEWRSDENIEHEPLWGQFGANVRYEVVSGMIDRWNPYFIADLRSTAMFVNVLLELKPFAMGKRQQLCKAKGGIFENSYGVPSGESRGLTIAGTTTNKMTNPVFGHSTWNNTWTAGADVDEKQNTDIEYKLFDNSSARLSLTGSGATTYTQTINVGNTNPHWLSCFVRKLDGSAVTDSDIRLYYGGNISPNILNIGNGWYRLAAEVTGVAAGVTTGVVVWSLGGTYFVDGFQIEEIAWPTPICYGDMIGCAWTGTAHASTSTRASGTVVLESEFLNVGEGSIRIVWKSDAISTERTSTPFLFHDGSFGAYYDTGNTDWRFTDGTNTIDSANLSYGWDWKEVYHFIWDVSTLKIYRNGVEIATGATYTPRAFADLYIGCNSATGNHMNGTFMGFTVYDQALTPTEVLADYTNISEALDNETRVDYIPWLWTKDGDNAIDSSDTASYDNWGIIGGIAGNAHAKLEITATDTNALARHYLSMFDMSYNGYYSPSYLTDNGAPDTISVDTTATAIGYVSIPRLLFDALQGRGVSTLVRGRVPTTDNLVMATASYLDGAINYTDYHNVSYVIHAANTSIDHTPPTNIHSITERYKEQQRLTSDARIYAYAKRTSGAAENFYMTSIQVVPRPFVRITAPAASWYGFAYFDDEFHLRSLLGDISAYQYVTQGDYLYLVPNRYNVLIINGYTVDPTDYIIVTLHSIPRWSLA